MSTDDLPWRSAAAIADAVRAGELTPAAVLEACLARIDACEPHVHAFVHRDDARAREAAARVGATPAGALCGVPLGLKDTFVTADMPTTAGSRILAGWRPPYHGSHARRLDDAGAVRIGKLSLDEFAMGSSNENVVGEVVRNPWSLDRIAGGSSGGAAAAVASGMLPVALGSDTGGSIRQPAAMCGVVGLKPSWGRVTRAGMIAFASSLDQAGPITRSVRDAALVLGAIAGHDALDSTCSDAELPDLLAACDAPVAGRRVGIPRATLELPGLDDDVRRAFDEAIAVLRGAGAQIVDVELPHFAAAIPAYYVICTAEAASNLARYDGIRYGVRVAADGLDATIEASRSAGFGAEVRRRILLGTFVLRKDSYEHYYGRAQRVRRLIAQDYAAAFARCDVIATPTAPQPAFAIGERVSDPLALYLGDVFTVGANLAALPAMSIPAGFSRGTPRLPIGLQLVGPRWREDAVLTVAAAHERATTWHRERPSLPEANA